MTTTASGNKSKKGTASKPLNPITIVWGKHYIPDTQSLYYTIDAVVTLRDTNEVKQFFLTAETREELLAKLFKKLGYNLKEDFQQGLWESQTTDGEAQIVY